jgi:hypothetical protein
VRRLGEDVQNSFAVDRDAVYIVSSTRMYRFSGRLRIDWRRRYANSGIVKPGQADAGSGTTPTVMHGGYVAITDNADPCRGSLASTSPGTAAARRGRRTRRARRPWSRSSRPRPA